MPWPLSRVWAALAESERAAEQIQEMEPDAAALDKTDPA